MILEVIQIILGIIFTLIVPGYLLSLILFKKFKPLERISIAIGLSIFVVVVLGFFLSALNYLYDFQGITKFTVWLSLVVISIVFAVILITKSRQK